MTEILLVAADDRFETRVRRAFGPDLNGDLRRWEGSVTDADARSAADDIARLRPEVVVLGPRVDADNALAIAGQLDAHHAGVAVVIVSKPTPNLWAKAMRAGVRGVIAPTAPGPELREAFEDALQSSRRWRAAKGEADAMAASRVICVVSPKGGSGKTTIATNLAVGLAARGRRVAIVDLDLQFGDVASALRLIPSTTMADVARRATIDSTQLKVLLTPHASGVFALCAPDSPAEGEDVRPEHTAAAIHVLSEEFQDVIVDTGAGLDEQTLTAIELATDLVLVATMDVPGVRSLRKAMDALDLLGMVAARRVVVLNRADTKVGIAAADVAATLGTSIDVFLPSSRDIPTSVNQGSPVLESAPRSAVGKAMAELVGRFVPTAPKPESSGGGWFHRSDRADAVATPRSA